jgi:hypothetical protein
MTEKSFHKRYKKKQLPVPFKKPNLRQKMCVKNSLKNVEKGV